jgi:hypothetical protein
VCVGTPTILHLEGAHEPLASPRRASHRRGPAARRPRRVGVYRKRREFCQIDFGNGHSHDPGGSLILVNDPEQGPVYQYNLSTRGFATSNQYLDSLAVAYSSNPALIVGAASVLLDIK